MERSYLEMVLYRLDLCKTVEKVGAIYFIPTTALPFVEIGKLRYTVVIPPEEGIQYRRARRSPDNEFHCQGFALPRFYDRVAMVW